ncbi:MAG: plastocyanin/azurin family copper-binding protein [Verrucomicrobiota bacterium]
MIRMLIAAIVVGFYSTAFLQAQGSAKPQWIWKGKDNPKTVYFHRQWTQRGPAKSVILKITCDNSYEGYLNGKPFGASTAWERPTRYDLTKQVSDGDNVLSIKAGNAGGIAGLVAELVVTNQDGTVQRVVTDPSWMVNANQSEDWLAPSIDPEGWSPATARGKLGDSPWGNILAKASEPGKAPAKPVSLEPKVHPEGFTLEKIYTVDKATQGSWVSMGVDDKGRLYCCDQKDKGLFRITLTDGDPKVEKMPVELTAAQGLLWHRGALYAGVNGGKPKSGLVRLTDSTGDDLLDKAEVLREAGAGGEHGIHGVVLSPDEESIYLVGGNYSKLPVVESSRVPLNYGEDQLLPAMIDARGHAKSIKAPGGWIARTDLDGKQWELIAAGFRNEYDAAFNAHGELFAYDSDMEWDLGTPWYRPTRIYHVTSGAEFGWRTGSGKFPTWHPDVLPPALDVGPGSPTGVVSGLGAKFPAKYQNAIYAFDWTYGTMYALHQTANGASYSLEKEEFVTGAPLYLTDGVIAPDGNMYFAEGGRGNASAIYRVSYTGSESTAAAPSAPGDAADLRALRQQLESYHTEKEGAVDAAWPHLGHSDRFVRFAARLVLEHQPVDSWADRGTGRDVSAKLSVLLALARQGSAEHQPALIEQLIRVLKGTTTAEQKLEALRIYGLSAIRMGAPSDDAKESLRAVISAHYPNSDPRLNRELCYTLTALGAPEVIAKTIPMLSQETIANDTVKASDELLKRNRMGGTFAQTKDANPQSEQLWYAYVLRNVTEGWTDELRRQYFAWFGKAQSFKGGASFQGYIENIRNEALDKVEDAALKEQLAELSKKAARLVPEGYEQARVIKVGVLPGLKFNTDRIEAKVGEKVAIQFINDDPTGMMHNLAVITPGSTETVVAAAIGMGAKGMEKNYIPEIPEMLGSTPQIAPGKKYTLYFTAPAEAGDYIFICTYPGHGMVMRGVFAIK